MSESFKGFFTIAKVSRAVDSAIKTFCDEKNLIVRKYKTPVVTKLKKESNFL